MDLILNKDLLVEVAFYFSGLDAIEQLVLKMVKFLDVGYLGSVGAVDAVLALVSLILAPLHRRKINLPVGGAGGLFKTRKTQVPTTTLSTLSPHK